MSEILLTEGSVKLYEYEDPKPELNEDLLAHFGILGQKWGQRNGPPYPLGSNKSTGKRLKKSAGDGNGSITKKKQKAVKKAQKTRAKNQKAKVLEKQKQQQIEQTKEQIIKNKDIKAMYRNIDKFTNQDINDILTRLDTEKRLKDRVEALERANESGGKKFKRWVKESAKSGLERGTRSIVSTAAENSLKLGTKFLAKQLVGNNDEYKRLVDQLFKEKKK